MIYQDTNFKICLSLFGWKENILLKLHIVYWYHFHQSLLCALILTIVVNCYCNINFCRDYCYEIGVGREYIKIHKLKDTKSRNTNTNTQQSWQGFQDEGPAGWMRGPAVAERGCSIILHLPHLSYEFCKHKYKIHSKTNTRYEKQEITFMNTNKYKTDCTIILHLPPYSMNSGNKKTKQNLRQIQDMKSNKYRI